MEMRVCGLATREETIVNGVSRASLAIRMAGREGEEARRAVH